MSDPIYTTTQYLADDRLAVSNVAGDSFVAEFAVGLRLRADCQADGIRLGTVTGVGHDAGSGRTLVDVLMDAGMPLTANLTQVLHGNDVPEALCSHAGQHALGGRDALAGASTAVAGLVRLASPAQTQAGVDAVAAVTPAGLATAAKGLIAASATIHVATSGSDATGTGAVGAPFASIAKALSSIAGKLIASGAVVTIQVADGTYTVASSITIDPPDADKIQILGNTSAETTVPIVSLDIAAKSLTVAGDHTANILVGDIIGLTGSSTTGLNGAYRVSGATYASGNTVVTCSAETFASATVGGGSIVIKPGNRCRLNISGNIAAFTVVKNTLLINWFRISVASGSITTGVYIQTTSLNLGKNIILDGLRIGISIYRSGNCFIDSGPIITGCQWGIYANYSSTLSINGSVKTIIAKNTTLGAGAYQGAFVYLQATLLVLAGNTTDFSPAANTPGNYNSYIGS